MNLAPASLDRRRSGAHIRRSVYSASVADNIIDIILQLFHEHFVHQAKDIHRTVS